MILGSDGRTGLHFLFSRVSRLLSLTSTIFATASGFSFFLAVLPPDLHSGPLCVLSDPPPSRPAILWLVSATTIVGRRDRVGRPFDGEGCIGPVAVVPPLHRARLAHCGPCVSGTLWPQLQGSRFAILSPVTECFLCPLPHTRPAHLSPYLVLPFLLFTPCALGSCGEKCISLSSSPLEAMSSTCSLRILFPFPIVEKSLTITNPPVRPDPCYSAAF